MTAFAVTPPVHPRPATRVWLPLAVSLALHALFGLAAVIVTSGEMGRGIGPVPVDTCVLDDGGTIILDNPSPAPTAAPPQWGGAEEAAEAFPAQVTELPIVPAAPGRSDGPAPATASGQALVPGVARGGTGLLRPPATARSVVFVIDRSLSMGMSDALPLAKRELLAGLDALPADAHFGVILYNRQAEPLRPEGQAGMLLATAANRAAVARLVEGMRAEGGTDHLAALRRALALRPDVVFFVTDADELTAEQVRNLALLNRGRAVIHAVELSNDNAGPEETPLRLLARLSGGTYRQVPVKR
jgi:hypothetical protein